MQLYVNIAPIRLSGRRYVPVAEESVSKLTLIHLPILPSWMVNHCRQLIRGCKETSDFVPQIARKVLLPQKLGREK